MSNCSTPMVNHIGGRKKMYSTSGIEKAPINCCCSAAGLASLTSSTPAAMPPTSTLHSR